MAEDIYICPVCESVIEVGFDEEPVCSEACRGAVDTRS